MTQERAEPVFFVHARCFRKANSRTFKDHVHFHGLSRPGNSENKIQGLSSNGTRPVNGAYFLLLRGASVRLKTRG